MAGRRTRAAAAAGIQKRKATAAKTSTQASKVAKKGGRKTRVTTRAPQDNERNDNEEELGGDDDQGRESARNSPMVINDHDSNNPLSGVTDPLQRMQIRALMAEEKRKQEIHGLDVRHREAQMTGPLTSTAAPEAPVDDFGESLLSSLERQQVLSFPTVPKKHVIAIARNTFDPANLPSLDSLIVDDLTSDVTISFEDGKIKQSKNVGKASAIKSLTGWSKNFITYVSIVSIFHGIKHPQIVRKLLEFHNIIGELSQTYDWHKAVLPLALLLHRTALHKGFADLDAWELPATLIDRYCRAHIKSAGPSNNPFIPKRTFEENPTNKPGVTCTNFNYRSCTSGYCKRDHKCSLCGGSHPAKTCRHKPKDEKA
jgi:hypothetical protein